MKYFKILLSYIKLDPSLFFPEKQPESHILVNIKDSEDGGTPLNEIATKTANFVDIAKLLVEHNVDVNDCDELGQ